MTDYWTVGFPELAEGDARQIVEFGQSLGYDGYAYSPAHWLPLLLDESSVEMLLAAVEAGLASESSRWDAPTAAGVESMMLTMRDWLIDRTA